MEANNNNELKSKWHYKSTIKSINDSITTIAVDLFCLHDSIEPVIQFFYGLLSSKTVDKSVLSEILDNINERILDSEPLTDSIRQEMNI